MFSGTLYWSMRPFLWSQRSKRCQRCVVNFPFCKRRFMTQKRGGAARAPLRWLCLRSCLELPGGAPLLHFLRPAGIWCAFPFCNRRSVSIIRLGLDFSLLPLKFLWTCSRIVGICSNGLPANGLCCPLPSWKMKGLKNDDAVEVLGVGFTKRGRISYQIIVQRCIFLMIWSTTDRKKRLKQ